MKNLFLISFMVFIQSLVQAAPLGSYFQSCNSDNDGNSYEQYLSFSDSALEWKFVAYEDANCQAAYLVFKRDFKTTAITKDSVQTSSLRSSYVSLTQEITSALNVIQYCGFSNWETNEAKDVTGRKCDEYQQLKLNEKKTFRYSQSENQLNWNNDPVPFEPAP